LSPLQFFLLACAGFGFLLIGLAALAPTVWYRWTSTRRKLLGRWRAEMALTGLAIFAGTGLSLLLLLVLGSGA
jgi:hypothetical protein